MWSLTEQTPGSAKTGARLGLIVSHSPGQPRTGLRPRARADIRHFEALSQASPTVQMTWCFKPPCPTAPMGALRQGKQCAGSTSSSLQPDTLNMLSRFKLLDAMIQESWKGPGYLSVCSLILALDWVCPSLMPTNSNCHHQDQGIPRWVPDQGFVSIGMISDCQWVQLHMQLRQRHKLWSSLHRS